MRQVTGKRSGRRCLAASREKVGEADCAEATGIPFEPEADSDNDIRLLVESVGLADGRRTNTADTPWANPPGGGKD